VAPITALFWYSAFKYFPSHFSYLSRRFSYYVFGDESESLLSAILEWLNVSFRPASAAVVTTAVKATATITDKIEL
jgi:hypothetical protein